MRDMLSAIERAQTYDEYAEYKKQLDALPGIESAEIFGYKKGVRPRNEWHADDPQSEYFWDPMQVIEKTTIPVLAVFGEMDTQIDPFQGAQVYRHALMRAGNPNFRIELIPGADHNIILSETGCLEERENRPRSEWSNYAPQYLDILEEWLTELRRRPG
jgi:pimeloyl-ACP methyl ester carboxylesterase